MGGFASAIGDSLSEGIAKVAGPVLDSLGTALDKTVSVEHILNKYPESKIIAERYHNNYVPVQKQYAGVELDKQLKAKQAATAGGVRVTDPTHPNYQKLVHPQTGQVLDDSPIDIKGIVSEGARLGRVAFLGEHDILGTTTAAVLEKKYGLPAAQAFSDAMGFILKDNSTVKTKSYFGATAQISKFKANVMKAGVPLKDASPTYHPPTKWERAVANYTYATFSPLLAIPHTATFFNGLFGTDTATFLHGSAKAMLSNLKANPDHWQSLVQTGAMTESLFRDASLYNKFKSSDRTFKLPNDSTIARVYKMFHQPGFSYLRDQTLISGATVGRMTAEQVARDFYHNPKSYSLNFQIKKFGLDPGKIMQQGGNLDSEDLDKAIFKFVDEHYFLDNTLQRSQLLQASPIGRTLGMYHGYVTRQAKLMSRAMFRDWKERGTASVVKNLAIGSLLFPLLGEGIKTAEEALRGQNALGDASDDLNNIIGSNGFSAATNTYFEMLGHVGAFGVYSHSVRGALTHSLIQDSFGPVINSGANLVQDTAGAAKKTYNKEELDQEDWAPTERDVTYDIPGISLLAQMLDHRVLPKKNENTDNDPLRELTDYMNDDDQTDDDRKKKQQENQ